MKTDAITEEVELEVRGMTCDSCALHVTKALRGVGGVLAVEVPGWMSGRAKLVVEPKVDGNTLTAAVKEAGYRARELSRYRVTPDEPAQDWGRKADYDLVVIGTGGAGMAAAIRGAELGKKVCLVEAGTIGGTCVNIGCVPSKTLIRAAETFHRAKNHTFAGVRTSADYLEWQAIIGQKDELVSELRQNKYVDVIKSYGDSISLVRGRARLQADGSIQLEDGQSCRPERIVIATGASPRILPLPGAEEAGVLTSTTLMAAARQPESLIVIGGRAIALELGQALARLGTKVTILQRSSRLLPEVEPEVAAALMDYLHEEGITIHTGVVPEAIRREGNEKILKAAIDGKRAEFRAEEVLMAVGRVPNSRGMGLEEAGIKLDHDGFVIVDDRMRTSNARVFAAGDVTTFPKLVYVAAAAGGVAAENALNGGDKRLDLSVLPDVIFTDPQVATVGLTEVRAREQGYEVKVANLPLAYVPRALAARDTRGLIKLIADKSSDRLLGAHILAAEGGEVIQTAALAVRFGKEHGFTVSDLRGMLFPYLVQAEGLKLAAQTFDKDVSQLSCCAG
jgi:mercuric reductase